MLVTLQKVPKIHMIFIDIFHGYGLFHFISGLIQTDAAERAYKNIINLFSKLMELLT